MGIHREIEAVRKYAENMIQVSRQKCRGRKVRKSVSNR